MSLDSSNKLREWFEQFWQYSEKQRLEGLLERSILSHVRENWEDWWEGELLPEQRQEIEQLTTDMVESAQENFVKWVEEWIGLRYPRRGMVVLLQLAQLPLFQSWECLKHYREGCNAIILQRPTGGSKADIKPLIVTLIPKEGNEPPYHLISWTTERLPLRDARQASLSILSGIGFSIFLLIWWLLGWKPRQRWVNISLNIGVVVGLIWLVLLITTPLGNNIPMLCLWAVFSFPIVVCAIVAFSRDARDARRCAQKWARRLGENQLCVLVGGLETGTNLEVEGTSFGAALSLSILLAIYKTEPVTANQSWLWWQLFDRLAKNLPNWAVTGEVTVRGWLKRVERMKDKIVSGLDHLHITNIGTSLQKDARPKKWKRKQPVMYASTCTGQAAANVELRLYRCRHITQILIKIGGLGNAYAGARNIALVLLAVIAVGTLPYLRWLILPPPTPELSIENCEMGYSPLLKLGDYLCTFFQTDTSTQFSVNLSSSYWENREGQLLYKHHRSLDYGYTIINLSKRKPSKVDDFLDGEIQVIRHRRFLFRTLPSVTVDQFSLRYLYDKMRDARRTFAIPRSKRNELLELYPQESEPFFDSHYLQGFETLPDFYYQQGFETPQNSH